MKPLPVIGAQTIVHIPSENFFYYFGWPTVARLPGGTLALAASGFRHDHICPWGKSVLFESHDEGRTWGAPQFVNDTAIDDRDTGLLPLPGGRLLLSWFTSDTRRYVPLDYPAYAPVLQAWRDEDVARDLGSFLRIREADGTWGARLPVTVSAPHGPVLLKDGTLFYLGIRMGGWKDGKYAATMDEFLNWTPRAIHSADGGRTWTEGCDVPAVDGVRFTEPHAIELSDGRILGLLRAHPSEKLCRVAGHFQVWKTLSDDRGLTWSTPEYIGEGSPPHLARHSSGAIVCTVGYRAAPFGVRALFSLDEGQTWGQGVLDDKGVDYDLGYPSTVELADGTLYTVFYRKGDLEAVRWALPGQ